MSIILHRFQGVDGAGQEWSFGWHSNVAGTLATSQSIAVAWLTDLWNGIGAGAGLAGLYAASTQATTVTSYLLSAFVPFRSTNAISTPVTLAGTSVLGPLPAQISVVCSLRTPQTGRTNRGRLYLPAPAVGTLTSTGELETATRDSIRESFLAAWEVSNPSGEQPVVFSKSSGLFTAYTEFGVADKFNTQRRRVQSLIPVRTFSPMP